MQCNYANNEYKAGVAGEEWTGGRGRTGITRRLVFYADRAIKACSLVAKWIGVSCIG
jgi:hypothetical protein